MLTLFCLVLFVNSVVIMIGSFVILLWCVPRDFCCSFVSVFVFVLGLWFDVVCLLLDVSFGLHLQFMCYLLVACCFVF